MPEMSLTRLSSRLPSVYFKGHSSILCFSFQPPFPTFVIVAKTGSITLHSPRGFNHACQNHSTEAGKWGDEGWGLGDGRMVWI